MKVKESDITILQHRDVFEIFLPEKKKWLCPKIKSPLGDFFLYHHRYRIG